MLPDACSGAMAFHVDFRKLGAMDLCETGWAHAKSEHHHARRLSLSCNQLSVSSDGRHFRTPGRRASRLTTQAACCFPTSWKSGVTAKAGSRMGSLSPGLASNLNVNCRGLAFSTFLKWLESSICCVFKLWFQPFLSSFCAAITWRSAAVGNIACLSSMGLVKFDSLQSQHIFQHTWYVVRRWSRWLDRVQVATVKSWCLLATKGQNSVGRRK